MEKKRMSRYVKPSEVVVHAGAAPSAVEVKKGRGTKAVRSVPSSLAFLTERGKSQRAVVRGGRWFTYIRKIMSVVAGGARGNSDPFFSHVVRERTKKKGGARFPVWK